MASPTAQSVSNIVNRSGKLIKEMWVTQRVSCPTNIQGKTRNSRPPDTRVFLESHMKLGAVGIKYKIQPPKCF